MDLINAQTFVAALFREVKSSIDSEALPRSRGEFTLWTLAVKTWLAKQCRDRGYTPLSNHEGESEFLLDFVWWKEAPGARAVLACECEWGNTRFPEAMPGLVAYDFDKLLSFKALFKLMIFDSYSQQHLQDATIETLNRYLQEFGDHRSGEEYVVVDMSNLRAAWSAKIETDGEHASLKLQPLSFE